MSTEKQGGVAPASTFRRKCGILTPQQRENDKRNVEIYKRFMEEKEKGSNVGYIYERLAMIYGLSVGQIGNICRRMRREVKHD
jgi:hypothetical protein